jgi:hypothetical protein
MQQKRRERSHTSDETKLDYYKFSRQDTNKSELTMALTESPTLPIRIEPRSDSRTGNLSKLSHQTNLTRKSKPITDATSLENKIKLKLEQLQEQSPTNQDLKFYTPERQLKLNPDSTFNMSRLKT